MKLILRSILLLLVVVGLSVCVFSGARIVASAVAIQRLDSQDARARKRGLAHIRDERVGSAAAARVAVCLERETDPDMVELAGYALMRTQQQAGVDALRARADRESDSALKAKLILYAARLADGDYRLLDWLTAGAASNAPWQQAASCAGLLYLGRPEGGPLLVQHQAAYPAEVRAFAHAELRRLLEPMSQTVGDPIAWSADGPNDSDWARAGEFLKRYASPDLLADTLARLHRNEFKWREVNRLLHARERVSKWLN